MKLLKKSLKEGILDIQVTNPEDLWYLFHIVKKGDLVRGKATRKVKVGEKETSSKRTFTAELNVEKTEYSSSAFRMLGIIVKAPEDIEKGAHQSIVVGVGDKLIIKKNKWSKLDLKRLDEAVREQASILIMVVDRDEATFAISKKKGVEILANIKGDVQKKQYKTQGTDFFKQVMKNAKDYVDRYKLKNVIVGCSTMWKDDLIAKADDNIKSKFIFAQVTSSGEKGIKDLMKTTEAKKLLGQDRTSLEIQIVEKMLAEISKQGLIEYGFKKVKEVAEAGAVEILVISEKLLKEKFQDCDKLMEIVEKANGEIYILSTDTEHGKQIQGLGGVVAYLRYKL